MKNSFKLLFQIIFLDKKKNEIEYQKLLQN